MTTKDYLNQVGRLNRMINNKLVEIAQLKELACSISAIQTGERVQTTPNYDKIGTAYAKIDEKERETDLLIDKYIDTKKNIIAQIKNIPCDRHRKVIYWRYIEQYSIHRISQFLGITDRGCKKLHKRAIEEFEKANKTQNIV